MKLDALKEYIAKTIQEELRKIIKNELRSMISEVFVNGLKPTASSSNNNNNDTSIDSITEEVEVIKPKQIVQYTKNPILNEILNETANQTTGGIPQEGGRVSMMGDGFNSSISLNSQISEAIASPTAPKEVKVVHKAITRDYRDLLKAVESKKKR